MDFEIGDSKMSLTSAGGRQRVKGVVPAGSDNDCDLQIEIAWFRSSVDISFDNISAMWAAGWTWVLKFQGVRKIIPGIFPGYSRRNSILKLCGIERYDDLLLPGHRLLDQLPIFAPGEHFEFINFQYSTVYSSTSP